MVMVSYATEEYNLKHPKGDYPTISIVRPRDSGLDKKIFKHYVRPLMKKGR